MNVIGWLLLSLIPLVASGLLGALLDMKYNTGPRSLYWAIGALGGAGTVILAFVIGP